MLTYYNDFHEISHKKCSLTQSAELVAVAIVSSTQALTAIYYTELTTSSRVGEGFRLSKCMYVK